MCRILLCNNGDRPTLLRDMDAKEPQIKTAASTTHRPDTSTIAVNGKGGKMQMTAIKIANNSVFC